MKTMTKKSVSTLPKFTIEAPKVSGAVAKLTVPRVPVDRLGATIGELLEKLQESGIEGKLVKGTLTVY